MKKILLGLLVLTASIVSCTDQEDIEIAYQTNMSITASHIFDDYEQFLEGDFDMSKDGWKLHLSVFVYDKEGMLVDKIEKSCDKLSESLNYMPNLNPGIYTVVSIADFRDGLGGKGYRFWKIENESDIQNLSITENDSYYPVVFETLGMDVQKVEITDEAKFIAADIKPVTCLVHVYMSDKDYSGWGIDGYSRFSVLSAGYFIKANKAKNNIRFEDGGLVYKYSEQLSNYNLAISRVYEKWAEKKAPTSYLYRALLPEENKGFNFLIQKRELPDDAYNTFLEFCGEFETVGQSGVLPEIASNKQYVVNMILDAMQLVVMEYPADYKHETYTEQFVKDYNKQQMAEMVNTKYENILGKDENYANVFLDMKPNDHTTDTQPYLAYYPRRRADYFEQYVTPAYLYSDYTGCCIVQLLLPGLSEDMFEYLKELLNSKFAAEEEGKFGPNYFTYLESGKPEDDSKYRVVLEKKYNSQYDKYTYFLSYNLRSKYYPQAESLWPDFTTLFGSDKSGVKSQMANLGGSYSFSDYSYSVNGSDYYYITGNDYADIIGFVFNTEDKVSSFWIYYKPAKEEIVKNYLAKIYTAADDECTSSVLVFYNSQKDLKVVLDKWNGAVIYTNLSMTQHETPQ